MNGIVPQIAIALGVLTSNRGGGRRTTLAAIALGVLTSNRGGGRRTTLADWTWHQGAISGCHRRVPL